MNVIVKEKEIINQSPKKIFYCDTGLCLSACLTQSNNGFHIVNYFISFSLLIKNEVYEPSGRKHSKYICTEIIKIISFGKGRNHSVFFFLI